MVAEIQLLETKLYVPGWRPGRVSRPRLIERMNQGIERKLTLVSAPAGFGKTTLLAEWLADPRPSGWVSLDPKDNDPALFWAYFMKALQKVRPAVGERALSLLHSPQPPPMASVLTTLINEIDAIEHDFVLILDDYHVIESPAVHSAIAFLLDHLPPRMHLVIASRSDPRLPLGRLRGSGELTELRASDLRFRPDEASAFLNQVMALDLSPADVAALETRTEGWIAGLQLAALSMQDREDVHEFLAAFSGNNRHIADYLVEEVLQRQPDPVRSFLLHTAILDRLNGPLCDAVTGQGGGRTMLEELERRNLFVVPLDDRRRWYRYHHLFAEVLQARAMEEHSERVRTLHQRASSWYEQNGSPADAIHHAFAAGDPEGAAGLIEMAWPAMERNHQFATWLGWAKALPGELVRARPVLNMGFAWALLNGGELEDAELRLRDVERLMDTTAGMDGQPGTASAANRQQFRSLPAALSTARAYLAAALGDTAGTVSHAQRLLELLPEGDHLVRAPGIALLGLAYWTSGDLEAAHRTFAESMAGLQAAGDTLSAIGGSYILGDIRVAQGRLRDAAGTYERALHLAEQQVPPVFPGTEELRLGLSEVQCEWGDLESASRHLLTVRELREQAGVPENAYRWCTAMARIKGSEGDLDTALELLEEAERVYIRTPLPVVRPIAAMKARIWIEQGRLSSAERWAAERSLSADDDLNYMREFEHITLARVMIARQEEGTRGLLDRLLKAADESGRTGSVIEILVLQSLAGNRLDPLARALDLAEPEGYLRVFVDEGKPMRNLLRHATTRGIGGIRTRRILSAFDTPASLQTSGLIQPLTARELEILRLIAAGMKNQEIADHLFISLPTVKRHIANVYGKLNVGHRTEAVARANGLNLL